MTGIAQSLTGLIAGALEHNEREAVLGDLAEGGKSTWQGLVEVLGLVVRRQTALWSDWRPWLAAFAVALPSTLLLMGVSFSIGCTYRRLAGPAVCAACSPTAQEDTLLLLCQVLLLLSWSWTVGFVVGTVSRRTLWVSVLVALIPCIRCLILFHEVSLSRLCLLLFLPPAILGAHRGLRRVRVHPGPAAALAATVTALMISAWSGSALWTLNWVLILPAWYIVISAWKRSAYQ
jgi:hypothetical protein